MGGARVEQARASRPSRGPEKHPCSAPSHRFDLRATRLRGRAGEQGVEGTPGQRREGQPGGEERGGGGEEYAAEGNGEEVYGTKAKNEGRGGARQGEGRGEGGSAGEKGSRGAGKRAGGREGSGGAESPQRPAEGGRREGVCARVTWSRLPSPSAALAAAVRWLQEAAAPPLLLSGTPRGAPLAGRRHPLSLQPAVRCTAWGPGAPPALPMRGPRDHRCFQPGAARR